MATTNNNLVIIDQGEFKSDLEDKINSLRADFLNQTGWTNLSEDQQYAFFMAIALNQYGNIGIRMTDGRILTIND